MRFLLITLVLCVFISCNKYENPHILSNKELLSDIRSNFKKDSLSFYKSFDKTTYNFRQSLTRIIHWNKAKQKNDTLIVPITLQLPKGQINSETGKNTLNHKVFLKVYKGNNVDYQFSMLTFIGEGTSFSEFSGVVYIEDYFKGNVQYNTYYQGIPSKTKEINYRIQTKLASVRDNKIARSLDCNWTKIGRVCVGHPTDDKAPDICSDRYEYQCDWTYEPIIIDEEQWEEDTGGGGGGEPLPDEERPDSIINKSPNKSDPCKQKDYINEVNNLEIIKQKHKILKEKTNVSGNEHADLSYMNLSTKAILSSSDQFTGTRNNVEHVERWYTKNNGATAFATTIYTHTHGFPSAPSPIDIFAGIQVYSDNSSQSLSAAQKATYLKYLTAITITPNSVYSISIKDPQKWVQKYSSLKTDSIIWKNEYLNSIRNGYTIIEAQEIALLNLYGDVIDLFKSPNTENLDFKPIVILPNPNNTDKRKVKITNKPCPTN